MTASPTTTAPAPATFCHLSGQISPASNGHRLPSTADRHQHRPTDPADDAGVIAALRVENTNLRAQLASMPVIEQAKGILIDRSQISPDAAFALLQRWSSHTNLKLRDISGLLVDAASHPDGQSRQALNGRRDHPCRDLERLIDWLKAAARPSRHLAVPCARLENPLSNPPAQTIDAATTTCTNPHDRESPR